jgi:hypothetical protein
MLLFINFAQFYRSLHLQFEKWYCAVLSVSLRGKHMDDKEYIEAKARQIAEIARALDEAEAAADIEGRARAAGLDYQTVMAAMNDAASKATPEALAEAKRLQAEDDAQAKAARAQAVSALSRSATPAAQTAPRRPRNMA